MKDTGCRIKGRLKNNIRLQALQQALIMQVFHMDFAGENCF